MAEEEEDAPRTELEQADVENDEMNLKIENEDDVVGTEEKNETTIVTQKPASPACSDLTDNNNDGDDQTPKTFPQKVSILETSSHHIHFVSSFRPSLDGLPGVLRQQTLFCHVEILLIVRVRSTFKEQVFNPSHSHVLPILLSQLMDILSNEEHSSIITWLPEGNGFIISKKKAFAEKILPKYFKASKFTSFTRKLNRWGFSRIPRGPQTGSYFHKFFQRDKPELCLQMTSNSGNKYQTHSLPQQLLPSIPGVMGPGPFGMNPAAAAAMGPGVAGAGAMNMNMGGMPMFPFMPPPQMMAHMTPQQQQAMFQQSMFHFQNMMMQQQQQMQQSLMAAANNSNPAMQQQQALVAPQSLSMPASVPTTATQLLDAKTEATNQIQPVPIDGLSPTPLPPAGASAVPESVANDSSAQIVFSPADHSDAAAVGALLNDAGGTDTMNDHINADEATNHADI